jgi:hypothetical protein
MIISGQFGKMAAMAELSLTLDLMGKHFFTETTWTIETKLFRNVHLMGLYKFSFLLFSENMYVNFQYITDVTNNTVHMHCNAFFLSNGTKQWRRSHFSA